MQQVRVKDKDSLPRISIDYAEIGNDVVDGEQLHALDVNGRSYCGCGASFCMHSMMRAACRWSVGRRRRIR